MDIKSARTELGLTQKEMADLMGIDVPLLSKMENGKACPTATQSEIVFKALATPFRATLEPSSTNISTEGLTPLKTAKNALRSDLQNSVLEALVYSSKEQPVSRETLKVWTKAGDRENRRAIRELRKMGFRIASSGRRNGYYLCKSNDEYQEIRSEYISKAMDMLETVCRMDAVLPGQMVIDDGEVQ